MIYAMCVAFGVILAEASQVIREARQDKHYQEWLGRRSISSKVTSTRRSRRPNIDPVIEAENAHKFFNERPEVMK
ncbi:hypothetical protein PAF15_01450 [Weissella koreensis]|uniref:hypothetical protein n=1 Tax=Weissella koreensis TaxID=165096 RepID=UPI0022BA2A96|nr:hypothetical protein [Weissella koreensis]MCZ9310643.1 hypothetical protein [Weissella koreensis]